MPPLAVPIVSPLEVAPPEPTAPPVEVWPPEPVAPPELLVIPPELDVEPPEPWGGVLPDEPHPATITARNRARPDPAVANFTTLLEFMVFSDRKSVV